MRIAKKANPVLWERVRAEAIRKMGGTFSARAMQLAVQLYKKHGGTYIGAKGGSSLAKWTKEDWGYVGEQKKSRYLPKAAREHLTVGEKAATSRAKNKGTKAHKQWVKQPAKIAKKTARYRRKGLRK